MHSTPLEGISLKRGEGVGGERGRYAGEEEIGEKGGERERLGRRRR